MGVFDDIFEHNQWDSDESVSGAGSTLAATAAIRSALPALFDKYDIHRILDIPCGDMNWWHHIEFNHWVAYLGADIVPAIIERNRTIFPPENTTDTFEVMDICTTPLYKADVIVVRDLFGHLPNRKIQQALRNVKKSSSTYLLATTFPDHHDATNDGEEGAWRPINLAEYWGLGNPIELISEDCKIPGFEDKALGLWRLK